MIEVVDNREVNCAGELHIELAERLADNLRAVHETQLAWAYERNARVIFWTAWRIEVKHARRWYQLWRLALDSVVLKVKEREAQAMVDSCRPAGPVRS